MIRRSLQALISSIVLFSLAYAPRTAHAQDVQVAFDAGDSAVGEIYRVDTYIREDLDLFPEYPTFEQALLFRTDSGSYRLEITYEEGNYSVRRTELLDSAAVARLRSDIRIKMGAYPERPRSLIDQAGRAHFLWTTAIASLGWYGPSMMFALEADESDAAASTYLLSAGAGFFIPYFLTQNSPMTNGMAAGARVGSVLGIIHAGQLFGSFGFLDRARDDEMRTFMGLTTLASIAEMGAGIVIAKHYDLSEGRMNLIGVGGVFGAFAGQAWSNMLFGDELSGSSLGLVSLAGSALGIYGANQLALSTNYTTGDAKAMMMGGISGTMLAASILAYSNVELEDRLMSGIMLGAGFMSTLATHRWLEKRDLRDIQGNFMILGTIAGGVLGIGAAAATDPRDSEPVLLSAGIGAAVGFTIVALTLEGSTRRRSELGIDVEKNYGELQIDLNPGGLAMAAMNADWSRLRAEGEPSIVPLAGFTYRF